MNKNNNKIFLLAGQLEITKKEEVIWTVLGSCISIIFYNKRTKLSAVCHTQLPNKGEKYSCTESCPKPCGYVGVENDFKYVSCAFKHMLSEFHKAGIQNSEIEVSLYGGSSMLKIEKNTFNIGAKNIKKALNLIHKNNYECPYIYLNSLSLVKTHAYVTNKFHRAISR